MTQEHTKYELQVLYSTTYIYMYVKQRKLMAKLSVWAHCRWPNFILAAQ